MNDNGETGKNGQARMSLSWLLSEHHRVVVDSSAEAEERGRQALATAEELRQRVALGMTGLTRVSSRGFCVVCGAPRLDADVTGLTCGSEHCIAEVVDQAQGYTGLERILEKFFAEAGYAGESDEVALSEVKDDLDELSKLDTMVREELAPVLGVDSDIEVKNGDKAEREERPLDEICREVIENAKSLKDLADAAEEVLKRLAMVLGVGNDDDDPEDLLQAIETETARLRAFAQSTDGLR